MAEDTDDTDKTEDPTAHRIEESRKKGEVAASKEVTSLLLLAGCIMTLVLSSVFIYETLDAFISWLLKIQQENFNKELVLQIANKTGVTLLKCIGPVLVVNFILGILANISQIGFLYAPQVLELKFDRVNPLKGAKNIFSKKMLSELVKGLLKFTIIISITYVIMKDDFPKFAGFLQQDFQQSFIFGKELLLKLIYSILGGMILVAIADFAWVKYTHLQKLKMTKQQVKEEMKEKEGNPEIKQKIKSTQREMARKRMLGEVKNADVIVTNPTHLSLAIKYDSKEMVAPTLVAKGSDHLALRIREIAKEHDIPMVENVPLARALYKVTEPGDTVPRDLYKAVAEVLAFVYKIKQKNKALNSGYEERA